MGSETDTIFALATPPGKSAIAVIRISGDQATDVPGALAAKCPEPGCFSLQTLSDGTGAVIDQALLLFMAAPRSSTGEDVVEIHCHGGVAITQTLLGVLANLSGLRPADAGEFTHRMFHNGKIDLLGAESLADIIDADTHRQLAQAWSQMRGALRDPVTGWRQAVIKTAAELEAVIDFPDEEIPPSVVASISEGAETLIAEISDCLDDNRIGEIVRDGVQITLLGPVNAGKSTLLNRIANRPVAIVSDEAGTTRDLVPVSLDIGGVPVMLTDTAGIRQNTGAVEAEGISRALSAAGDADYTIIVVDGSRDEWRGDYEALAEIAGPEHILVVNKTDLGIVGTPPANAVLMSFADDCGFDEFLDHLAAKVVRANSAQTSAIITRARHRQALEATIRGLKAGLAVNLDQTPELVAEEFRSAATALGRITGEIDAEDLLESIFSSFCIGK
jgi:tRNA modification GTPase